MAIAFDTASGQDTVGTSISVPHTCSALQGTILIVNVFINSGQAITSAKYAGVDMYYSGISKTDGGGYTNFFYYTLAPASGTNNIDVSVTASTPIFIRGISYTGADVGNFPDAVSTGNGNSSTVTAPLATMHDNSWTVLMVRNPDGQSAPYVTAGTNSTLRTTTGSSDLRLFDSNSPISPTQTYNMTANGVVGSGTLSYIMVSIAPYGTTPVNSNITSGSFDSKMLGM